MVFIMFVIIFLSQSGVLDRRVSPHVKLPIGHRVMCSEDRTVKQLLSSIWNVEC